MLTADASPVTVSFPEVVPSFTSRACVAQPIVEPADPVAPAEIDRTALNRTSSIRRAIGNADGSRPIVGSQGGCSKDTADVPVQHQIAGRVQEDHCPTGNVARGRETACRCEIATGSWHLR